MSALREGASGTYVLALQGALLNTGAAGTEKLTGTGYFGPTTKAVVQGFQRRHHINPSGLVGFTTWVTLMEVNRVTPKHLANPQVSPGQHWPAGAVSYHALIAIEDVMDRFTWATEPSSLPGSVYNGAYVAAVKAFQSRVGINPSGIFGAKTASALSVVDTLLGRCGC
ncbi:MAG: peptidoglycan-binding protein [Nakamurella sp.]